MHLYGQLVHDKTGCHLLEAQVMKETAFFTLQTFEATGFCTGCVVFFRSTVVQEIRQVDSKHQRNEFEQKQGIHTHINFWVP